MRYKDSHLTVLGKVQHTVLKKVIPNRSQSPSSEWFFIDFSETDIPVGEKFDIYMHSDDNHDWNYKYKITLKGVYDQLGNKLSMIERGYKTIAYLEFSPNIPTNFKDLPELRGWKYQKKSLIVGKQENFGISSYTWSNDLVTKDFEHFLLSNLKEHGMIEFLSK